MPITKHCSTYIDTNIEDDDDDDDDDDDNNNKIITMIIRKLGMLEICSPQQFSGMLCINLRDM